MNKKLHPNEFFAASDKERPKVTSDLLPIRELIAYLKSEVHATSVSISANKFYPVGYDQDQYMEVKFDWYPQDFHAVVLVGDPPRGVTTVERIIDRAIFAYRNLWRKMESGGLDGMGEE